MTDNPQAFPVVAENGLGHIAPGVSGLLAWARRLICRHDWLRSRYVNIATGDNLGCLCTKCGKWKP